ncbi:MAG: DUF1415 domain-containing protein [Actinomycetota bacterium]|nr:DUF1415 domain-containing protein [Actinomycetota bacterium]
MSDDARVVFAERVECETRRFVEGFVIELGLCPFAKAPWSEGRVEVRVSGARDEAELLADLDAEMAHLRGAPARELETSLLVHPHVLADFAAYNDFLDLADALLRERGHEGVLQIASFHPDYRFAGAPSDDPANATNRSPWPMLHLIREASITAAIAAHPDPGGIPARNVELLRQLGPERVRALLEGLRDGG